MKVVAIRTVLNIGVVKWRAHLTRNCTLMSVCKPDYSSYKEI